MNFLSGLFSREKESNEELKALDARHEKERSSFL
jgi:hypothetical protein